MNREKVSVDGRVSYGGEVQVVTHYRRDLYMDLMRLLECCERRRVTYYLSSGGFIAEVGFLRSEGKAPKSSANLIPMRLSE